MIGRTISHYRIDEKLGEGGMGVVYRATDLNLNRPVAIKFLSASVADEDRRRRFQQEAQTASSLNHPHILTVFEAGTTEDNQQYLVTEFIDGYTLREWARRTEPSERRLVDLLVGVADGLAAAHQAAIIHRDIKPENILVAKNGYAKLVDFGLAKLLEPASQDQVATRTLSAGPTRPGMILGTIAYMAPEQAAGKPVDARADIFAFGVVLYDLLTGERPFTGKTDVDVLHGILNAAPKPVGAEVPYELRAMVGKALEKDPADRYQSMREMVVDLKRFQRMKSVEIPAPTPVVPRRPALRLTGLAAAVLVAALAVTGWLLWRSDFFWQNPLAGAQFTRSDFEGAELDGAISLDGKFVAFLSDRDGQFDIWMSQAGTGESVNLTQGRETELLEPTRSTGFSHDGSQIWLRGDAAGRGGFVRLMPAMGGVPRRFLLRAVMVAWSPDGKQIVYHEGAQGGDPIFIAEPNGSNPRQLFAEKLGGHNHFVTWSPDQRFIYFVRFPGSEVDEGDIWRIPTAGGEPERITRHNAGVAYPAFLGNNTLLYVTKAEDGSGPWLYRMDVRRRIPHRLTFGVEQYLSIAASSDGRRLVATVANPRASLFSVPISERVIEESEVKPYPLPSVRARAPRFGPDYLTYLSSRGGADGLWKFKDGRSIELWKGADGALTDPAAVSPDGRQMCISFPKNGRGGLYTMSVEGADLRPLAESLGVRNGASWSPDGKWLAVGAADGKGPGLFKVPVEGGPPVRLADQPGFYPAWSPDGRFIVYSGAQVGRRRNVMAVTPEGKPWPLPDLEVRFNGQHYRFLPGGKSLVLMRGILRQQNFWLLDMDTGRLRQLTNLRAPADMQNFDITTDGKKIVFDRLRENSDIVLIDLKR